MPAQYSSWSSAEARHVWESAGNPKRCEDLQLPCNEGSRPETQSSDSPSYKVFGFLGHRRLYKVQSVREDGDHVFTYVSRDDEDHDIVADG